MTADNDPALAPPSPVLNMGNPTLASGMWTWGVFFFWKRGSSSPLGYPQLGTVPPAARIQTKKGLLLREAGSHRGPDQVKNKTRARTIAGHRKKNIILHISRYKEPWIQKACMRITRLTVHYCKNPDSSSNFRTY
jgi:hypothetical protein